jgi:hypothetical protein
LRIRVSSRGPWLRPRSNMLISGIFRTRGMARKPRPGAVQVQPAGEE